MLQEPKMRVCDLAVEEIKERQRDEFYGIQAFLDYYDVPYTIVKVNPISRKEIKWSDYKKVPILMVDGEQLVDSLVFGVLRPIRYLRSGKDMIEHTRIGECLTLSMCLARAVLWKIKILALAQA
ncbi:hypothetical protein LguiB_022548 [Lonicera macranthoides]